MESNSNLWIRINFYIWGKALKYQRLRGIFFLVLFLDTQMHQNKAHCKLRLNLT
ncbi:hypothetical protein SAMN05444143_11826 [Flavobacterium succinicans]|jgi:hypothetical protein|uniref:Uncharacterized protein n=1 Tax=Flavobacterium succinicans TaxID=29536 RepID=A0A1I4ZW71_9FLAO|nr:hypothetical protein SAMN05444143_11826 [Flavobacterium succinicans]